MTFEPEHVPWVWGALVVVIAVVVIAASNQADRKNRRTIRKWNRKPRQ